MMQTDVVLSPESVDITNGINDNADSGDAIVGGENEIRPMQVHISKQFRLIIKIKS